MRSIARFFVLGAATALVAGCQESPRGGQRLTLGDGQRAQPDGGARRDSSVPGDGALGRDSWFPNGDQTVARRDLASPRRDLANPRRDLGVARDQSATRTDRGNDPYAAARQLCVERSNQKRALVGAGALVRSAGKEPCADGEAKIESDANASGGAVHSTWGSCGESAQNLCGGMGWGIEELMRDCIDRWYAEGPGTGFAHAHYYQLINPAFTKVACGFYLSPSGDLQIVQTLY